MYKILLTVLMTFGLACFKLVGQCEVDYTVTYDVNDEFSCLVEFEFSFTTQSDNSGITTILRNCDNVFQSKTLIDVSEGENVTMSILVDEGCECIFYEPILVFINEDSEGNIVSTQCPLSVFSLEKPFDNCPNFEKIDGDVSINGEFDCTYFHTIRIDTPYKLDSLEIIQIDCDGVTDNFSIVHWIEANQSIELEINNNCDCEKLELKVELYKDESSLICYLGDILLDTYNFLTFPLELHNFEVSERGNKLFGEWKTLFEININEFSVEYSIDGNNFNRILTVDATLAAADYSYELLNQTGYYRLNVINQNGDYGYSPIVFYEKSKNSTWINGILTLDNPQSIFIYNIHGQLLYSNQTDVLDVHALDISGLTIIEIEGEEPVIVFLP